MLTQINFDIFSTYMVTNESINERSKGGIRIDWSVQKWRPAKYSQLLA